MGHGISRILHLVHYVQELEQLEQALVRRIPVEVIDQHSVAELEADGLHRVVHNGDLAQVPAQHLQVLHIVTLHQTVSVKASSDFDIYIAMDTQYSEKVYSSMAYNNSTCSISKE